MSKFPRDNSEVKAFAIQKAPESQVLRKAKPSKDFDDVTHEEELFESITVVSYVSEAGDTDNLPKEVLKALSEASESFSGGDKGEGKARSLYGYPDELGTCLDVTYAGVKALLYPVDFLTYLRDHPRWTYVEGDSNHSAWSCASNMIVLSFHKGSGPEAI